MGSNVTQTSKGYIQRIWASKSMTSALSCHSNQHQKASMVWGFFCIRTLLFWTQQEALKSWPGEPQVSQLNFHLDLETRCSSASPALYANLTGPFRAHRRDQASRKTWHRRQHYHLACKTQRGGLSCMMWNICTQFPLCRGTLMSCNIKQHVEHHLFKKK